jgi:hypothetical protein
LVSQIRAQGEACQDPGAKLGILSMAEDLALVSRQAIPILISTQSGQVVMRRFPVPEKKKESLLRILIHSNTAHVDMSDKWLAPLYAIQ